MFKIQLTALDYPFPDTVNVEDPQHFRKCIHWLEDLKIRHYPIENRDGLRKVDSPIEWYVAYKKYKIDLAVPYYSTTADELDWFLNKAILLEYQDVETYHHVPLWNLNVFDDEFVNCVKQLAKMLKIQNLDTEEQYVRLMKEVSMKLRNLDSFGAVTPEEYAKIENQVRILKLLELQGIKKILKETIKKETLDEIQNDVIPPKQEETKVVVVPEVCPPPPNISDQTNKEPISDDCFIVEAESDIPAMVPKTTQSKTGVKLDLCPLVRNILTKISGNQLKKVCKEARHKNRRKEKFNETGNVVINGIIALPELPTPKKPLGPPIRPPINIVKPGVLIPTLKPNLVQIPLARSNLAQKQIVKPNLPQKPIVKPNLAQKPIVKPNLAQKPTVKPHLAQKPTVKPNLTQKQQFPAARPLQNQFPQKNGNQPQTQQPPKVQEVARPVPVIINGSLTMKRCSTPVPIAMADKKQKVDEVFTPEDQTANPLKVFIYNETVPGGKITEHQSGLITQKLLQLIDEDTSKSCHLIRFDRCKLENGLFGIVCANEFARDWLQEKVGFLDNLWPTAALRLTQNNLKFSKWSRLSAFIPAPIEPSVTILKRISRQNPMLNTESWKMIGYHTKKKGVQIVVGMNEESFKCIQLVEMRPYYGLTRITFKENFNS